MDKKGNFTDQYDFKNQTDEDVKGQSVQIIDIKKDSQSKYIFNLKENALNKILDQVGNHEVFINAIAGPSRQGKSFMLSFMLRYLENNGKKDWLGRDKPNQKLKGFHWKNGDEAETLGIWMWSKPFFMKNSSGKEIAVLLVDTQGVFDNILTNREWAIIVGLCLLTCSSTIFNLFSHLQENSLQVLDTFMAYGLAAMCCDDNDSPEYPFQKLVFLIRDHNNPDQYPYGKIGGKKLLDSKLKIKDDMQRETQLTRKNIKRCFSELECYLMPPIGEEAKRVTYDGNLNVLPEKFISNLEEFVSTLLDSDKLSSKLIAGNPVKGRDLLKFFQTYIDIFNSGDIPDPKPLLDATATVNYANASNEAVHQIYVPYMTDKLKKVNFLSDGELVRAHKFVLQKANQLLKNKPKMGDPLILENSLVSLNKILNEEFIRLSDANKTKMQLFLQKLVEDCTRDFKEIVDSSVNKKFWLPHQDLQNLLSNSEKNIIENFDTMCEDAESEALQPYLEKLKNSIKTHNEVIINDNKRKLQEAEKYCSEAIENALHNYTASMESELSKKKYFNAKDLESVHTNSLLLAIDFFNEAEKIGDEDFFQKYDLLLRNQVNKTFLSFEKDNTLKMEMCHREQEKEISVLIMNYRKGLQSFLTNEQIDMEKFEQNEKMIKLQCDEQFNLLSQSCDDAESTAKLKDTYESSIVDCKFEYELKCQTSIERRENNLSKLVSKLVENYKENANQIKSSLSFTSKVQLEEFHEKCSHEVIKDFEDSFPIITAIETKFLEELKEKLMKKGTKMIQENEARNDTLMKSSDIIKFESKSLYIKDMKSIMSDIFNREDLTIKHNELKEKALTIFMTQNQFHDEGYVETSIKCLNEEIEEEFAIIENNFTADRSKLAQSLMNDEVEAYQNKITAKLNDSEQDLEIIHQSLLEEATAGFKSAMRHISNEEQHLLQKLKDKLDTIFITISDEYKIKKLNSEKCAQLVYIQVKKTYFECMKTCVDSILDENQLKKKHEEFEQIAKDEFMNECKLIDKQTLTKFLDKLSNEVDREFKRFRELFDERLETNMTNFIADQINKYELKLMEKFETSHNISNVALEELHNICLNEAQNNFKKIYNSYSTAEENHLIKLCDGFDNTHKKFTSEIFKKQENQMMRAKFMISDLKNQYFHQIKSCFNQISSKSHLRAKHESLIKALEEKFKTDFNEYDQNEVNSLISNLINECETYFVSLMESFKEKKQTDLRAVIDREISNYSIKINKNVESVPVLEETLKKYHQTFLDEAVQNFKESVDNFSAEEEDSLRSMISEIEDYFQKVITENDNLISNLEKSAQIIIFELKNEYNMRMRSNTGESISRDELQLKHQHFKNQVIQQFRKNKFNEGGILERLVTKLSDYIENEFIIVSDSITQNRGMALDKAISEIVTEFHIKLDEKINNEKSLNAKELQDFYNKERDLIIENFKTNFKICENEHKYIETLIEKLKFFFDKIIIRIEKKNETSLKNSQNVISELKNKYNEKMKTCLNEAEDENVLKEKHNKFKDEALNDLKLKLIGLDSILVENSTEQLFNELESIFCDVLELFKINNEVLELKLKSLIDTAKNCYITEMDQNISKNKLLTEEQLSKIHELSKILAFNKLVENSSSKNVPKSIRKELNGSLEVIFNNYRKDNDLKSRKTESIGIDLGTTFCCVGVVINGKVKLIPLENEKTTLPSYISFTPSGEELFGTTAKEQAYENPSNTIYDAKRLIGRNFDDKLTKIDMKCWPFAIISDNNKPKVELRCSSRTTLHAEEISAKILRKLKEIAESYLNCEIKNAVITVPAYFNDAQRQATKDAGCIAGLKVLKILNEPTSAAVAYSYQAKDDSPKNIFVFDLGGGTFDVAIVVIDKGKIHVKAVGGDTHLGGQDFDQRIIELCKKEFGKKLDDKALQRLKNKCEQKKLDLTYNKETTISIDALMRGKDFRMTLTRSTFEEINKDLFDKTMELVSKALFDARMEPSNIDEVILVGGSTRIPKIQELLSEYFKGKPLNKSINPDEAVAYGAAIQAAILDGDPSLDADKYLIQDVAPFNIGVEVEDGTNSIIIPKNTKLPCQNTECYVTVHNNQKIIAFKIYEGDDRIAMNNKLLGQFRLEGLPPKPAGQEEADVTMTIDDEGILHVKARSRSTFNSKKITIQDSRLRIPEGELKMLIRKGKY